MSVGQYIGARYVPKFMGTFDNTIPYEPLSIVDDGLGNSYTSKIPVPAGSSLTDTTYWALTGSMSGAITSLQNRVTALESDIVPIVNVLYTTPQEFGAVADGVTDDTQAFQDALDSGKNIYVPEGDYLISDHLQVHSNTIIWGNGTLIDDKTNGTNDKSGLLNLNNVSNVEIASLKIHGQGATTGAYTYGCEIYGYDCQNIIIRDLEIDEVLKAYTICFEASDNVHVDNCYIHRYTQAGISFINVCNYITVTNNRLEDVTGQASLNTYPIMLHGYDYAISSLQPIGHDIICIGNIIENPNVSPWWEGIDAHGGERMVIVGNTINNTYAGVAIAGTTNFPAHDVVIANNTCVGPSTGIARAINNAGITVASGNNVDITGNTIKGFGKLTTTSPVGGGVFITECEGVNASSNIITDCHGGTGISAYPFYVANSLKADIHDNYIYDNNGFMAARFIGDVDGFYFHGNTIRNSGYIVQGATTHAAPNDNRVWDNDTDNNVCSGATVFTPQTSANMTGVVTGKVGDIVMHSAPSSGNPIGWICTAAQTAGTPATWLPMANL